MLHYRQLTVNELIILRFKKLLIFESLSCETTNKLNTSITKQLMKKLLFCFSILIGLSSCERTEIDFDNFDDLRINSAIQVPLVNATLTLGDLLLEDTLLTQDADGGLRVIFNQDSIFSLSVIDFVNIPEQTPTIIPVIYDTSANAIPLDIDLALGTLAGAELESCTFDRGFLAYEISTGNAVNSDVDIRLTLKNATLGGLVFDNVLTLPEGTTTYKDSIDVSGLIFDMSNGGTAINFLGLRLAMESADSASPNQLFNLSINFENLAIGNATGFFGSRVVNIPNGSFDFEVSAFENFASGLFLTDPKITIFIDNGLGIELDMEMDLFGVNGDGLVTDLALQTQTINSPVAPGSVVTSSIEINKGNSQIVDFLASLPNQITYGGVGTLNPSAAGGGTASNFIDKASKINANLVIDLPLQFRAENMRLEEIINVSVFEDTTQTDQLEELSLFFRVENGFPFDVDLAVSFIDSVTGDSLDGFTINLLNAAPVDAQGRVTQKITSDETISLSSSQFPALIRSNQLKIDAKLNTTLNGVTGVKMYTDYDLEIKIASSLQIAVSPFSTSE